MENLNLDTVKLTLNCPMCETKYTLEFNKENSDIRDVIENLYCHKEDRLNYPGCESSLYTSYDGDGHFPCCCKNRHG